MPPGCCGLLKQLRDLKILQKRRKQTKPAQEGIIWRNPQRNTSRLFLNGLQHHRQLLIQITFHPMWNKHVSLNSILPPRVPSFCSFLRNDRLHANSHKQKMQITWVAIVNGLCAISRAINNRISVSNKNDFFENKLRFGV